MASIDKIGDFIDEAYIKDIRVGSRLLAPSRWRQKAALHKSKFLSIMDDEAEKTSAKN